MGNVNICTNNDSLIINDIILPKWVTWIECDDSVIFYTWNIIKAWCKLCNWNVIEFITDTKDWITKIIEHKCNAKVGNDNHCININNKWNPCVIEIEKQKTT